MHKISYKHTIRPFMGTINSKKSKYCGDLYCFYNSFGPYLIH